MGFKDLPSPSFLRQHGGPEAPLSDGEFRAAVLFFIECEEREEGGPSASPVWELLQRLRKVVGLPERFADYDKGT